MTADAQNPGKAIVEAVTAVLGAVLLPTPVWLRRPGEVESGKRWGLVNEIYSYLTGMELPSTASD